MKALAIPDTHPRWWPTARRWVARYKLWLGAGAIIALGLALGWNSLAAAGILPILFAMLPCMLMMAVCMKGMGSNNAGSFCSQNQQTSGANDPPHTTTPASLPETSSTRIQENDHA